MNDTKVHLPYMMMEGEVYGQFKKLSRMLHIHYHDKITDSNRLPIDADESIECYEFGLPEETEIKNDTAVFQQFGATDFLNSPRLKPWAELNSNSLK